MGHRKTMKPQTCDRCDRSEDNSDDLIGLFDVKEGSHFHKFARPGENKLCRECLFSDGRFLWTYYA